MTELDEIKEIAERILASHPDPVVQLRLLRDVLKRPLDSTEVTQARMKLSTNRWVQELEHEQWSDGSWGRFHTEDTKAKQKIATTETGVNRALALGLDASHPILLRTMDYITRILNGTLEWRDHREVSWGMNWVNSAVQLISAATLAQIQPDLPILEKVWNLWYAIVCRAFPSGKYDREQEIQAHLELLEIRSLSKYAKDRIREGKALTTFNKYHIMLLGSHAGRFPRQLETAYLSRIWNQDDGIGYLGVPLMIPPAQLFSKKRHHPDNWLTSIELLTPFPSWRQLARDAVGWLWQQRNERGFWNLGPRPSRSTSFPLSDNWRKKAAREFDWTTSILTLLRKYYE